MIQNYTEENVQHRMKSIPTIPVEYGTIQHDLMLLRHFVKCKDENDPECILAQAEIEKLEKQQAENALPANTDKSFLQLFKEMFVFDFKTILERWQLTRELYKSRKAGRSFKDRPTYSNFKVS